MVPLALKKSSFLHAKRVLFSTILAVHVVVNPAYANWYSIVKETKTTEQYTLSKTIQIYTIMKKQNSSKVNTTITETAAVVKSQAREQLKSLSNSLMELAKAAGRTDVSINELLRETYQVVGQELRTFEGWQAEGANIRKGQHAYLFWGAPVESKKGFTYCPIQYLFTREQVHVQH